MRYSVSTCSFVKLKVKRLLNLPEDIGVEIMCEYGSRDYWNEFLTRFQDSHSGGISIHAPFAFYDFALPGDDGELFDHFCQYFDLYHKFNSEFYVLHAFNNIERETGEQFAEEYRRRAIDRIARFHDICATEGVCLAVENTFGNPYNLFTQERWLDMFESLPGLHALIDTGHALVSGMDIAQLQKTLGSRVVGYHLHNNDGTRDMHDRLRKGCIDWNVFMQNAKRYTPDATGVIEYLSEDRVEACTEDINYLKTL